MLGWLVDLAASLRSSVGDYMLTLRFQERGDEANYYAGSSQDESVETTRLSIERDLGALEGVVNLLRQMRGVAPVGVVA